MPSDLQPPTISQLAGEAETPKPERTPWQSGFYLVPTSEYDGNQRWEKIIVLLTQKLSDPTLQTAVTTLTPKRYLTPAYQQAHTLQPPSVMPRISPIPQKALAWLIVKDPKNISADALQILTPLQSPAPYNELYRVAQRFRQLLRDHNHAEVAGWLNECEKNTAPTMANMAAGLRQEQTAFTASVRESWSHGPVEGQITRLKLLKRQMYGRAKLDLLRIRFLTQTSATYHHM